MPAPQDVSKHYTHGNLTAAISAGVRSLGKTINSVSVDDLAPVDEFHIGGRQATVELLDQLADLDPPQIGGAHRDAVGSAGDAQVVGDEALFIVVPHQPDVEVVRVFVGDDDAHRARDVAGQPGRADQNLAACCDVELHRYSIGMLGVLEA